MAEIILDIGSGRSLHNIPRAEAMIKAVADMDSHNHRIIFKAQLFQSAPPNIPLDHEAFGHLYHYAKSLGYDMTASVFDKDSLTFLLRYRIPFVKIACRPELYWLIGEVPRKVPVYVSYDNEEMHDIVHGAWEHSSEVYYFACVRQYPATLEAYHSLLKEMNGDFEYERDISDHTVGWDLFNEYHPVRLEKHLCPEREADNPDSGPFAVTVDELREVIA